MIVDVHVHFSDQPGYAEQLAAECARLGIDKVCAFNGVFKEGKLAGTLLDAGKKHPKFLIPFAYFRLGDDHADLVDRYHDAGYKGMKCIRPRLNYDDKTYYPVYDRAERLGMPILFHLGIVARGSQDRYTDVNNDRMRPVYLDTIARAFPGLTVIGAHFGNPWSDEAAMCARWNPNLFFDLSGSILKYRPPEFFKQLLWWGGGKPHYQAPDKSEPWHKILFGTDVGIKEMEDVMNDYKNLMSALNLSDEMKRCVMGGNAARSLKLDVA